MSEPEPEFIRNMTSTQRYAVAILVAVLFAVFVLFLDRIIVLGIGSNPAYAPDLRYLVDGSNTVIGIVGAYIIYRIACSVIDRKAHSRSEKGMGELKKIVLRILFFFFVIFIALSSFGVSLSGALAGGAIGGVVIGLAMQTITTSILSGVLVSTSKTILPGDVVLLKSSYWGSVDIPAEIAKVRTIYTEVRTQNGQIMRLPNPLVLNYTLLTHLENETGLSYPLTVVSNADVKGHVLQERVQKELDKLLHGKDEKNPEIHFISRTGATNTYVVMIYVADFLELNGAINTVNRTFEHVYWEMKEEQARENAERKEPQ